MATTLLHTPILSADDRALISSTVGGEFVRHDGFFELRRPAPLEREALERLRQGLRFDLNPVPPAFDPNKVRLLVTDMDSTLINIECIDEIAGFVGRKAEVAAITESAMRGEIDFATSLTRRVALLEGLDESALLRVYEERLRLNPGAEALIAGLRRRGIRTGLVSGGFTFFTERLTARLGIDYARANRLEVEKGRLTGRIVGEIVDAEEKARFLERLCAELGTGPEGAIAMGDGANDLRMIRAAGLGVAYRAKPKVQAEAGAVINHGGLDSVLHFLEV